MGKLEERYLSLVENYEHSVYMGDYEKADRFKVAMDQVATFISLNDPMNSMQAMPEMVLAEEQPEGKDK